MVLYSCKGDNRKGAERHGQQHERIQKLFKEIVKRFEGLEGIIEKQGIWESRENGGQPHRGHTKGYWRLKTK